jgi:hypothetical protein
MVSEQPNMNRYTHSASTKFYHEQSTQIQEGQDNSETEESDFGPCLIGNAPPIMSHPPLLLFLPITGQQQTLAVHNKNPSSLYQVKSQRNLNHSVVNNRTQGLGRQTLSIWLMQLQLYCIQR